MNFQIGQNVSYPNHGVCKIENISEKQFDEQLVKFYSLRVAANNSLIYVPTINADSVGIRPVIDKKQCGALMAFLATDFPEPVGDWKIRTRQFAETFQTGNLFDTADVLKKLTFIQRVKKLSFREQKMFEKARFLVVSEIALACSQAAALVESQVEKLLNSACLAHQGKKAKVAFASH